MNGWLYVEKNKRNREGRRGEGVEDGGVKTFDENGRLTRFHIANKYVPLLLQFLLRWK